MNCIIVDDEPMARKGLRRLVETRPELHLSAMLDSAESAIDWLRENEADLVFLDIEMPGLSGMDMAKTLPHDAMVIFTTAYQEYAAESYEVEAIDYLLKPINPFRFNKAVDRAISLWGQPVESGTDRREEYGDPDFITVKSDRRYVRVRLDEILYVECLKDYLAIRREGSNIVTRMTIKAMEEMLPRDKFMRVSRSYIVNRLKVDAFDSNDIFIGDKEIAIGLSYKEKVLGTLLRKTHP